MYLKDSCHGSIYSSAVKTFQVPKEYHFSFSDYFYFKVCGQYDFLK